MNEGLNIGNLVRELGGVTRAAEFFECSPQAISKWKRLDAIPKARLLHLKAARPDLFEDQKEAA